MKKYYTQPELEVLKLMSEDILAASNEDTGFYDDEVTLEGDDLFN